MKDKVTLYIATHNKTKLKYFGKTIKYFNQEDLQNNYHGSGKYWNKHLNKHGDDVTMEIYKICSLNELDEDYVEVIALNFSEDNDIVNSTEWANLIPENGLDGGYNMLGRSHSDKSKLKNGNSHRGKTHSEETKAKISSIHTGKTISEEHKLILSKCHKNKIITEETRNKLKLSSINRVNIVCPYCDKSGDPGNMKRWHFDKCKNKEICLIN